MLEYVGNFVLLGLILPIPFGVYYRITPGRMPYVIAAITTLVAAIIGVSQYPSDFVPLWQPTLLAPLASVALSFPGTRLGKALGRLAL
jgi:hypothetical protein